MVKRIDIAGQRYGSLTAIKPLLSQKDAMQWLFYCDCGTFLKREGKAVRFAHKSGQTVNCGCVTSDIRAATGRANKTHGLSRRKLYGVHRQMFQRCENSACKDYPSYGGRGITICDAWTDIQAFFAWAASSGYREGLTIERNDVNGNYEPGNCTWIPNEQQAHNRRVMRNLTIDGETHFISEWARRVGLRRNTIVTRLRMGWSAEDAVKTAAFARREA